MILSELRGATKDGDDMTQGKAVNDEVSILEDRPLDNKNDEDEDTYCTRLFEYMVAMRVGNWADIDNDSHDIPEERDLSKYGTTVETAPDGVKPTLEDDLLDIPEEMSIDSFGKNDTPEDKNCIKDEATVEDEVLVMGDGT